MLNIILTMLQVATSADSAAPAAIDSTAKTIVKLTSPETFTSGEYHAILSMLIEKGVSTITSLGGKLIAALIVFWIGKWIIGRLKNVLSKVMEKRNVDPSLASFLRSLANVIMIFILLIFIVDILGLQTSSFVALFASAGVAVGLALSGTLQNFAGGVMILLFRPFKVGDYVAALSNEGTVKEIQIFNTLIRTDDGKVIIVPNGNLSTSVMTNYTKEGMRRVNWTFGIGYGDDVDKAKKIVREVLESNSKVKQTPPPYVAVKELNASSVDLIVLGWVEVCDYWSVTFETNEAVYKRFMAEGINIPYPQMDVHMVK